MPANNALGGLNEEGDSEHTFAGQCIIPAKGSWVWIFFEGGDSRRPFYMNAIDLQNTKVLPECQLGSNYQKKWVIFKSHEGRCVVISDDPDDARVEITGKKRNLSSPPVGDTSSVYTIDGNQTTILMDERSGKEKILVRTYKGDFINIDVTNQKLSMYFKNDIEIQSDGNIILRAAKDIITRAQGNVSIVSTENTNIRAGSNLNTQSNSGEVNIKSGANLNLFANGTMNNKAAGPINSDGASIADMSGAAGPANTVEPPTVPSVTGDRD